MVDLKTIKELAPTDNLYKFMAIGGIVLAVAAMTVSAFTTDREMTQLNGFTLEFIKAAQERNAVIADAEELHLRSETERARFTAETQPYNSPSTMPAELRERIIRESAQFIDELHKLAVSVRKVQDTKLQMEFLQSAQNIRVAGVTQRLDLYATYFYFGIFVSAVGFLLWYIHLQRPMDQLLLKELAEHKSPTKPQDVEKHRHDVRN